MIGSETSGIGVDVKPDTAEMRITSDDWQTSIDGAVAVTVDGQEIVGDRTGDLVRRDDGFDVVFDGPAAVTVDCSVRDRTADVDVTVRNDAQAPITVDSVEPLEILEPALFETETRLYGNGYSLTQAGCYPAGDSFARDVSESALPLVQNPDIDPETTTSHYLTALTAPGGTLTMGFLDHDQFLPRFDFETTAADGIERVVATCPTEHVELEPGEELTVPTLRLSVSEDMGAALRTIAADIGDRMDVTVPERTPTGWCSWYDYDDDIDESAFRDNMEAISSWGVPIEYIQIDAGYNPTTAGWTDPQHPEFGDLEGSMAAIGDTEYDGGFWMAPFCVAAESPIAQQHPEWLVTENGEPVDGGEFDEEWHPLDTTHPGAREWLRDTIERVVEDWGCRYLKLDFLAVGALPGDRYNQSLTRVEAYRAGLSLINDVAGDDVVILGCNAPFGPSIGLVDSFRVGWDVGETWSEDHGTIRTILSRQPFHRRLWINDPDCQILREDTELTEPERRSFATAVALTGGANFLSDAVPGLSSDAKQLFERTLPTVDGGIVPDLGTSEIPERLVISRDSVPGIVVAGFNWSEDPQPVTIDPQRYGLDAVRGWDVWQGASLTATGSITRDVPPHGCLLLQLVPDRDRPAIIGSAEHLAGYSSQIDAVDWDGDAATLEVTVDARDPIQALVSAPGDWRVDGRGDGAETVSLELSPGQHRIDCRHHDV